MLSSATQINSSKLTFRTVGFAILITLLFLASLVAKGQNNEDLQDYEDITVFLMVQNVGGYEIDAIYMNDNLYVDVATLFQILKINHVPASGNDSITGFFLDEEKHYSINADKLTAVIGNSITRLQPGDIIRNETGLYLKNTLYGKLFGLNLNFNFRSLSLELKTELELPIIKELRQEQMRKNIDRLSGVIKVDTTIGRNYHVLRGGMADWSVISTQNSGKTSDTRASLGAGIELLGGEATGLFNYSTFIGLDERQQQYKWRWVNNEAKVVRQVQVGKIPVHSTSSLYAPVIGASITNTPTTFRRSFGSYILTDYTEPGWTVELYINNVIVDFTTADASGFFQFQVPMVYGSTQVMLKFYGPWGEERVKEQTINVPYNFLPAGKVEYNMTGGIVRDSLNSTFSRAEASVGLHRNLTMGAGIEYLSALKQDQAMPFITASARFLNNFLFTGEYTHNVKTHGLLNYRLPSNLVFELDYTKYVPGQKAISYNYLEERKASLSIPVKVGEFRSFARMSYRQNVLPLTKFSSAELLLSSFVKGVSTNLSANANWLPDENPYIYSNLAFGFRLGHSINFRPQVQFDITNAEFISYKAELEKNFSQLAHLSVIYENNVRSATQSVELSFRYDLSFAQTATSARISERTVTTTESARGSVAFGSGNGYVHADNRSATGRSGITITQFLDLNDNNIKDVGEPVVSGLSARLNGGRFIERSKDSLIRIIELEPYTSYLLELEDVGFENIAWQLKQKEISVLVDPNQFKKINIPIKVMGEANGTVNVKKGRSVQGQGRIIINFINDKGKLVNRVLSESDGYFNFLGFAPGKYTAVPDSAQLNRLHYKSEPASFEFTINPVEYGDIIDNIIFTLTPVEEIVPDNLNKQENLNDINQSGQIIPNNDKPPSKTNQGAVESSINTIKDTGNTGTKISTEPEKSVSKTTNETESSVTNPMTVKENSATKTVNKTGESSTKSINEAGNPINNSLSAVVSGNKENELKPVNNVNSEKETTDNQSNKSTDLKKPSTQQVTSEAKSVSNNQPKNPEHQTFTLISGQYNESAGDWFVQAGAYKKFYNATNMYDLISKKTTHKPGIIQQGPYYKVRVGNFPTQDEAQHTSDNFSKQGIKNFIENKNNY